MQTHQLRSARSNQTGAAESTGRARFRPPVQHAGIPLFVRRRSAAGDSPLLRKPCGCGHCAACSDGGVRMSEPGDPLERAADAVAERVMRSTQAAPDAAAGHSVTAATGGEPVPGAGRALDAVTRAWMEPRFGTSFESVRIHDGPEAARYASLFAAHAYTFGEHVVFGTGQYQPGREAGRRLIAHELAHVLQWRQGRSSEAVTRTVDPDKLSCPANKAGAGADPAADLASLDGRAQGFAQSMAMLGAAASILDPASGTHAFDVSYQTRMGTPAKVGKKFRDRFSGKLFATEKEAAQKEAGVISSRFGRILAFLADSITYKCRANGVAYTLGGCPGRCRTDEIAQACVPTDKRTIGICPAFWDLDSDSERAGTLVHEAAHARLDFGGHGHGSRAQRGRNPACYESMVADVFGFPADDKCPPV
jgi:hypothetical protein